MKLHQVKDCFFVYAKKQGMPYTEFPLGVEVDEFGGPYLELGDAGSIAIVARDRGQECMRKETSSPEELARWIFEIFNRS